MDVVHVIDLMGVVDSTRESRRLMQLVQVVSLIALAG